MKNRIKIINTMRKIRKAHKTHQIVLDYLPLRLWVELTNNCNLRCSFCPNSQPSDDPKGQMSFETFKKIIDQTCDHVYDINLCHRGESLLNDEIVEMVAYARKNKVATRLNTNATLLTEDMSRKLIDAGLDFISFSFDGFNQETYEKFRVGARFDVALNNIMGFLKIKASMKSRTPYTMIELLDLPDLARTPKQFAQFRKQFNGLPVDKITIKPLHNWGGNIDVADGASTASPAHEMQYAPCTNLWYAMVVLWDGSVPLCVQDWYNENPLGNVNDCRIVSMWNCETIVSVRELLINEEYKQCELCSHCDLLWRPAMKGIPVLNLIGFLSDTLIGYGTARALWGPLERRLENTGLSGRKAL